MHSEIKPIQVRTGSTSTSNDCSCVTRNHDWLGLVILFMTVFWILSDYKAKHLDDLVSTLERNQESHKNEVLRLTAKVNDNTNDIQAINRQLRSISGKMRLLKFRIDKNSRDNSDAGRQQSIETARLSAQISLISGKIEALVAKESN